MLPANVWRKCRAVAMIDSITLSFPKNVNKQRTEFPRGDLCVRLPQFRRNFLPF